ncbi:hypothetical protein GRF29_185g1331202, partial [Pseudopithomyces chartarum]
SPTSHNGSSPPFPSSRHSCALPPPTLPAPPATTPHFTRARAADPITSLDAYFIVACRTRRGEHTPLTYLSTYLRTAREARWENMALPSEKQLDRIVKGTVNPVQREDLGAESGEGLPPPYTAHNTQTQGYSPPPQAYSPPPQAYAQDHHSNPQPQAYPQAHPAHPLKTPRPYPPDPTSLLPSSPPQIYLNLLILEASLRSQYLTLRARRRQNTFVLTLLALWIAAFFYAIWLRPRDDGKGIGGSGYWIIDGVQKMCFITGIVTALLFWATGQWERGVRWPRRWIGVANRGLRGMNAKIVVMRGGWGSEILDWISFMVPFRGGLWGGEAGGSSYHFVNLRQEGRHDLSGGTPRHRIIEDGKEYAEEDIAPGGDLIKLLLLPKPFTPDFREGWEIYRAEYWERENERRGELRRRIRARQREVARQEGGLFWWTGWHWRRKNVSARASDFAKGARFLAEFLPLEYAHTAACYSGSFALPAFAFFPVAFALAVEFEFKSKLAV